MIAAEKAEPFLPKKALLSFGSGSGGSDEESPGFTGQDAG